MVDKIPDIAVGDWSINTPDMLTPWAATWWTTGTITSIPGDSVGWMLAQGWVITGVSYDGSTVPPTATYAMTKEKFNTTTVLQHLLNDFNLNRNNAKWANEVRYNEVVQHWAGSLAWTEQYMDTQADTQTSHVNVFLADLTSYMDEIDTDIDLATTNTALLANDYGTHDDTATAFLNDLGNTELARINEKFTGSLTTQLQHLTDNGMYGSVVAADLQARNTRDANEEIGALNDRLNREKWENEHRLYGQQVDMRKFTTEDKHRTIVEKMNVAQARLAGLGSKHAEDMQLMKYMIDTRNQFLVGLYGFVERRDDIGPEWNALAQIVAGLGDSGGGWISP